MAQKRKFRRERGAIWGYSRAARMARGEWRGVRMTLALTQSGGYYPALLPALRRRRPQHASTGTFYAAKVANPTFTNGVCPATLKGWKVVSGSATLFGSVTIPCHSGMALRGAMIQAANYFLIYLDSF
jgi:hypothetical protein